MKTLTIATLALAGIMLSTVAHAQTVNICDRTEQVRDAIMQQVDSSDCAAVDSGDLAVIREINLLMGAVITVKPIRELKSGDFDGLIRLQELILGLNNMTTLPSGLFRGLSNLRTLWLNENLLTTLPSGLFSGLSDLRTLWLHGNELTTLPAGLFDGLSNLQELRLESNELTTLPVGLFRGLGSLEDLDLQDNWLVSLPDGLFNGLGSLRRLNLENNHLVDLTADDPLFDGIEDVFLSGQTDPPDGLVTAPVLSAAVPLLLSASHSGRQGFVRIVNTTDDAGSLRVSAIDDGGNLAGTVEVALAANQSIHFNSGDLENGNSGKAIAGGVGAPRQGDWRLSLETELYIKALAYVRTSDGFLAPMHDVLRDRDAEGRLAAWTFNPASNMERQSRLRLTNTGESEASMSIEGVDDAGETATVTLTLPAGQSRTLTAIDLEEGAMGLTGTLGNGDGKWSLFIDAPDTVTAMSLLYSVSGHISNLSSLGDESQ